MKEIVQRLGDESRYGLNSLSYRIFQKRRNKPKRTLVGGTQKTGTTWMMRMITSIPGYHHVGNFHGDLQKYWNLKPGDVVHAHDRFTPELAEILNANHIQSIITFRDPRDQVISRVFHIRRDAEHRWHKALSAMSMDEALMTCIEGQDTLPGTRSLVDISYSWMTMGSNCLCIRYEDMLRDDYAQFQSVLKFLDIKLPNALVRDIVKRNRFDRLAAGRKFWKTGSKSDSGNTDSHFRKGVKGDWHNYFKPEHVARFKELLGDRLIDLGYEKDLDWNNGSVV